MTEPCTVTGVLRDAAGDLLTSTKLSFQRLALLQAVEGDTVVAPVFGTSLAAAETVTTDGTTAAFSIDLMPGVYRLSYQGGTGIESISFAVPVAEARDLAILIGQATTIDSTLIQTVLGYKQGAEAARDKAQDWAEGTEPGGAGTKSAREYSVLTEADADATAADRVQTGLDRAATASSAAQALSSESQAELAAIAAGAPIVTTLGAATPNGTVVLLKLDAGLQVHEVVAGAWVLRGWLVGPRFDTVPLLKASTAATLGPVGTPVWAGDAQYEVAPAGAVGHAFVTDGGVSIYVVEPDLGGGFQALRSVSLTELSGADPRLVASRLRDGYIYGYDGGNLYRSTDAGDSWTQYGPNNAFGGAQPLLLLAAGDGEVLALSGSVIFKTSGWGGASFTSSSVLSNPTASSFLPWGMDTIPEDGLAVVTHYDAGDFTRSRYVWLSQNHGATWSIIRDLASDSKNDRHIHFATFDPWANNRIWICHHSAGGGSGTAVEYSDDLGATWNEAAVSYVNKAGTIATAAQPTTAVATPAGMVFGSDDPTSGLFVARRDRPGTPTLELLAEGPAFDFVVTTNDFATYSERDPETGIVYTVFNQATAGGRSYIMASDGRSGSVVWSEPASMSVAPGLPGFSRFALSSDGILALTRRTSTADSGLHSNWHFRASKTRRGGPAWTGDKSVPVWGKAGAGGWRNIALGIGSETNGLIQIAIGRNAKALSADGGIAIGEGATSSQTRGYAFGDGSQALSQSIAMGHLAYAGAQCVVIGDGAGMVVGATEGVSIGRNAVGRATSVVVGSGAQQTGGVGGVAIGYNARADNACVSVGLNTNTLSNDVAIGHNADSNNGFGVSIGQGAGRLSSATGQVSVGRNAKAHTDSIALGRNTETSTTFQLNFGPRHLEMVAPAAEPAAAPTGTRARIYVRESGGKVQFVARFPTGAVQIIAAEP